MFRITSFFRFTQKIKALYTIVEGAQGIIYSKKGETQRFLMKKDYLFL